MHTWCWFFKFWQWSSWLPVFEWVEDRGARDWSHWTKHCQSFLRFLFATDDNCLNPFYCPELGCVVVGLVTSPRGPSPHVSRYYTTFDLCEMIAGQDYLINVLPSTAETNNILNRCVFLFVVSNNTVDDVISEKTSNIAKMSALSTLVAETLSVRPTSSMLLTITSSAELSLMFLMLNLFLKIRLCGLTKVF